MEILGYSLLVLLAAIVALLLVASQRPNRFRTERSLKITASPETLFPLINDLREMNTWNPFALRETGGKAIYSGAANGPGQKFEFAGQKSGAGTIEIVTATPPSKVDLRLIMVKPFKCDNLVEFTLAPDSTGTTVTWAMSGTQPLMAKVMTLFVDCDKMVGKEFETGLANLRKKAER